MNMLNKKFSQRGQAMILVVIFFVSISLAILFGIMGPVLRQQNMVRDLVASRQSYYLAEAGVEDVVYRLIVGDSVGASETVLLQGQSVVVTTTDTFDGKEVSALGDIQDTFRKVEAKLQTGSGIAFNYGLQAGNGGVTMGGGSTVNGNIYSNGNIDAVSATITGSAIAADSASLTANQVNEAPIPATGSINFRNTSSAQDFAQSFQISSESPINKVQFYIRKVGNPSNASVRIVADNNGSPSNTEIATGGVSLSASQVTTSYGWVEVVFSTQPSLQINTPYWVVIDSGSQNASNHYVIAANNTYAGGTAKTGSYPNTWNATNLDGYFRIYTGGISSEIGGASYATGLYVGQSGVGDAWASIVRGTTVAGSLFCTTGTNNNKACNTSKGSPSPVPFPFSESNMDAWKAEAESGGVISGNHTVGWAGATMGPKKITGNLTVNGGGTLTLTGTLWVEGTVTITSGGKVVLDPGFADNSGTIISDDRITISGGGSAGSGVTGSYLFLVSTSKCPNEVGCSGASAITVTGGAGAVAVNAQYGNVALSGGASIKAAVGNSISITGGSSVVYEQGLASPSFVSGPSGGYSINAWRETE